MTPLPAPEVLGRNGTYVVVRKLHTRVAAFRQYDAPAHPGRYRRFRVEPHRTRRRVLGLYRSEAGLIRERRMAHELEVLRGMVSISLRGEEPDDPGPGRHDDA